MLDLVLMFWISWLFKYKSLFFTTNNSAENTYWDSRWFCFEISIYLLFWWS